MIETLNDLKYYISCDRIIAGKSPKVGAIEVMKTFILSTDYIGRFMLLLRTTEYLKNRSRKRKSLKILYAIVNYFFRRISFRCGFSIPLNVFGPGLLIPHYGTIVINAATKVGSGCVLHTATCIAGKNNVVGDDVYISTGSIITGAITIANKVTIGANSMVNKDIRDENILIAGSPAKIIKSRKAWYEEDGEKYTERVNKINNLKKK